MSTQNELNSIGFIVDTDTPAHDFAQPLGAYLTGRFSDGIGEEEAAAARKETPDIVAWCSKHAGYALGDWTISVESYPTPGWCNDGMGGHYREGERGTDQVRERYLAAVREYEKRQIDTFMQYRARDPGREAIWESEIQRARDSTAWAEQKGPGAHRAFMSVALWFNVSPPEETVATWKRRAAKYLEGIGVKVTGFRLTTEDLGT